MPSEYDVLLAFAQVGEKCRDFIQNNDVGRYLYGRAQTDIADAVDQLKVADPDNPKIIRDLQNQIYRAESIVEWLNEAIEHGEAAFQQLEQPEE